ncbi:hypothetical protein ANOM_004183 [Aspergillus nomiae NRRL 13137]|uniref:Zn(2)-C6 fungal-type domain-containing protein n=1 Tax=Aspergillus nomiae NRRL (strain ATCC 15546 / NRRL 13137 / CBS 260.88 / M93) TaxID=1509407 RepID=A0A0L1J5G0_ASPN3|nr:uncharacterized protein ANOM_004183 [Aspergillus nomiae NRRL 13137]KNG86964.1 hypothetical protein ANOM_004183 [Aspergillus nomiae NRRL 13137]
MGSEAQSTDFAHPSELAALSCRECRRRKIKCSRQLPVCDACITSLNACVYPAGPLKPGPKAGCCHRSKKRKLEPQSHSPRTMDMGLLTMVPQHDTNAQPGKSFLSPVQEKGSRIDVGASSTPHSVLRASNEPSGPSLFSQSPEQGPAITHRRLSWLVHPNHEPIYKPSDGTEHSMIEPLADQCTPLSIPASLMKSMCDTLQTDEGDIYYLVDLYFENMMSFTLFTPHLLNIKLQTASPSQATALLAAMFSFSARFRLESTSANGSATASETQRTSPSVNDFYRIATASIDQELMDLKSPPPLLLLQAMVLLSFHDLIESAEGRGWRSLGRLVRIAYELRLHLVDRDVSDFPAEHPDTWSMKEERRRTWWAIWEFDIFASTVRRLPPAIDWSQNWTMLPVDDECWLQKKPKPSCYLVADPMERSKVLQRCGSQSGKAWFIVAKSLMRTAYCVSNSQEYFWSPPSSYPPQPGRPPLPQQQISAQIRTSHEIVSNALYCFSVALPRHLGYRGQHLFGNVASTPTRTKQRDSDIYSIQCMLKTTAYMLNDPNALETGSRPTQLDSSLPKQQKQQHAESGKRLESQQFREMDKILAKDLSMADAILSLVRNSDPDHVYLVNPFVANTIWLATAIFLVYKHLWAFHKDSQERLLVESNIDLLQTTLRQFVEWWNMSDILEAKLSELEKELASMRKMGSGSADSSDLHQPLFPRNEGPSLPEPIGANAEVPKPPRDNSDEGAASCGLLLNGGSSMVQDGLPPGNADELDPNETLGLVEDRGCLPPLYEKGSGLFDDDLFYNVELQGFLDGMFAAYRGQDP